MFGNSIFGNCNNNTISFKENNFTMKINIGDDEYQINVQKMESSKILMTCNLRDDILSLYDYSLE